MTGEPGPIFQVTWRQSTGFVRHPVGTTDQDPAEGYPNVAWVVAGNTTRDPWHVVALSRTSYEVAEEMARRVLAKARASDPP